MASAPVMAETAPIVLNALMAQIHHGIDVDLKAGRARLATELYITTNPRHAVKAALEDYGDCGPARRIVRASVMRGYIGQRLENTPLDLKKSGRNALYLDKARRVGPALAGKALDREGLLVCPSRINACHDVPVMLDQLLEVGWLPGNIDIEEDELLAVSLKEIPHQPVAAIINVAIAGKYLHVETVGQLAE
jgi:hypothetical protein